MTSSIESLVLDNMSDMVIVFDTSGKITYFNNSARKLLGIEAEMEAGMKVEVGIDILDVFPTELAKMRGHVFIPDKLYDGEYELDAYRQNKTCFPIKAKIVKRDEEYVTLGRDITSQKILKIENEHAKDDIEATLKMKSEFVANVTHELRTPVNGIEGNAKELQAIEDDKKKLRLLDLIRQGCANMNALINNILDFSKLDAGKLTLENREFEFRKMIDYVKGNHVNKITEKGLDFIVNISPEIPEHIIGDELRIGQILNNLLSNASKFTSVGRIMMEATKTAQMDNKIELFFVVVDTGIGVSKNDQDKLFKSFSQVDASISRNYGGTGLGLNISKQLVEQMGGDIRLQSEVGKGSTFSFNIWVEVPKDEVNTSYTASVNADDIMKKLSAITNSESDDKVWQYGTPENLEEIRKKVSKLILCIEMENWDKAESFMETIRNLTKDGEKEVKTTVLKLKMAVQKEDYDKSITALETLKEIVKE